MIYNKSTYNSEWDISPLNKLGDFRRGKSKHRPRNDPKLFVNGKYPFIQTGDIKASNLYIESHSSSYNDLGLQQSKLWDTGTLCITIAANIAETAVLSYPMCFPDSVVGFVADKNKTSELFMHYVFSYIKKSIQNSAIGSIQDNIDIEVLTNLDFKVPKKPLQDKIVELLSAIDLTIALNNKINKELELMAKTLYNYWFIQFDFPDENGKPYKTSGGEIEYNKILRKKIPKGWKGLLLKDWLEFERGVEPLSANYSSSKISDEYIPFYKVRDMEGECSTWIPKERAGPSLATEKDILVSFDGTIGKIAIGLNGAYSTGIRKIYQKKGYFPKSYIYFIFQSEKIQKTIKRKANPGSNIVHAASSINFLSVAYDEKVVKLYNQQTEGIFNKILHNKLQNKELMRLKDFLLPLFMIGQAKVN